MPTVLFVHNGTPGRFAFLARVLTRRGWRGALINGPDGFALPDLATVRWNVDRGTTKGIWNLAIRAEADLIRGRAAAEGALKLRQSGFVPDLIIGHPGWGEMALMREVFPEAKQIQLGEFYYRSRGADSGFDTEFETDSFDERARVHAKNTVMAMSYLDADRIVVPTPFQASLFPALFRPRIAIIHEGVDTAKTRRQPQAAFPLSDGKVLDGSRPVVTFINRYFEPLRGFHIFMRALPRLQMQVPDAEVLLIGSDESKGYGKAPPPGVTWKQLLLQELDGRLDMTRVHFTGPLPYERLLAALSISAAHVYLTYPFVLSWSLLDAMACECLLVGSDTAPVRDVIRPGVNGLLVDFFDHGALGDTLAQACRDAQRFDPLRKAARETVVREYDRALVCEPAWLSLIDEVMKS